MMELERVTISKSYVVIDGPSVPTGTPHTDEMRSMVSDLRNRGEASPLTRDLYLRVARQMQERIERDFYRAIYGGSYASSDMDSQRQREVLGTVHLGP